MHTVADLLDEDGIVDGGVHGLVGLGADHCIRPTSTTAVVVVVVAEQVLGPTAQLHQQHKQHHHVYHAEHS